MQYAQEEHTRNKYKVRHQHQCQCALEIECGTHILGPDNKSDFDFDSRYKRYIYVGFGYLHIYSSLLIIRFARNHIQQIVDDA